MQNLIQKGALPEDAGRVFKDAGKGKIQPVDFGRDKLRETTFLNALSQYIPEDERVITIEDSAELQIQGIKNLIRLNTMQIWRASSR